MSRQCTPLLTVSIVAAATINADRFITHAGAVPAAGASCAGVARSQGAAGQRVPVDVMGTSVIETGGAIAAGALVESDNLGRAVTASSGVVQGRLAPGEVATAAGQYVEILLLPPRT